jgi:hypothetical protein
MAVSVSGRAWNVRNLAGSAPATWRAMKPTAAVSCAAASADGDGLRDGHPRQPCAIAG